MGLGEQIFPDPAAKDFMIVETEQGYIIIFGSQMSQ